MFFGKETVEEYQLNPEKMPRHIAIIMDGNGRWATKRALPRKAGHKAGAEALEKIIYAADYAEPGRDSFPGLELIREQVFQNLDAGIRLMLQQTIDYVKMKKKNIHPLTLTTLEYFNEEIQNH